MHSLKRDFLAVEAGAAMLVRPRRQPRVAGWFQRLAIGQILREQFVYEVHGPYLAVPEEEPRPPSRGRWIGGFAHWARSLSRRMRLRRVAGDLSGREDRLLKDIGLARAEIDAAVFGSATRARQN